jgi:uncharacterized protein (UPF0297 family)
MIVTRGFGDNSLIVTRGYGASVIVEYIASILPQFITRRVDVVDIVRRIARVSIVRREDD